jgi:hypothetical protein
MKLKIGYVEEKDSNYTKTIFSKFRQRAVAKFRMKQRNFAKLTPQKFMGRILEYECFENFRFKNMM